MVLGKEVYHLDSGHGSYAGCCIAGMFSFSSMADGLWTETDRRSLFFCRPIIAPQTILHTYSKKARALSSRKLQNLSDRALVSLDSSLFMSLNHFAFDAGRL